MAIQAFAIHLLITRNAGATVHNVRAGCGLHTEKTSCALCGTCEWPGCWPVTSIVYIIIIIGMHSPFILIDSFFILCVFALNLLALYPHTVAVQGSNPGRLLTFSLAPIHFQSRRCSSASISVCSRRFLVILGISIYRQPGPRVLFFAVPIIAAFSLIFSLVQRAPLRLSRSSSRCSSKSRPIDHRRLSVYSSSFCIFLCETKSPRVMKTFLFELTTIADSDRRLDQRPL